MDIDGSEAYRWLSEQFDDPLEALAAADPALLRTVQDGIDRHRATAPPGAGLLRMACGFILWAVSQEIRLGQETARGVATLFSAPDPEGNIRRYCGRIASAAATGPELSGVLAAGMPSVLRHGDETDLSYWEKTVTVLLTKGTYALYGPLATIGRLYDSRDPAAARASMQLFQTVFGQELTYNRSRHLLHLICRSIEGMKPAKRAFQVGEAVRIAETDADLLDPFFEGLESGLHRLNALGLHAFVDEAIERRKAASDGSCPAFLSLASGSARSCFEDLLVAATWDGLKDRLRRYVKARMLRPMTLAVLDERLQRQVGGLDSKRLVFSGSDTIYVAEEIDEADDRYGNEALYHMLIRLEIGFHEFGTYDFDWIAFSDAGSLEGAAEAIGSERSDLETFFERFEQPDVAEELFSLLELARIRFHSDRLYPGIFQRAEPILIEKLDRSAMEHPEGPAEHLYRFLVLRESSHRPTGFDLPEDPTALFADDSGVERTARLTIQMYPRYERCRVRPFPFPYGWKPSPKLVYPSRTPIDRLSERLQRVLLRQGTVMRRSDLRRWLQKAQPSSDSGGSAETFDAADPCTDPALDGRLRAALRSIVRSEDGLVVDPPRDAPDGETFWYPEWDERTSDYLSAHVRVIVRHMGHGDAGRYAAALGRYAGLVCGIRRAFETMRPQGIDIRRGWVEGDTFDDPLLIDWLVCRKAGTEGPERFYVHRIKSRRDVAVLLLVDLSRSTAHPVEGHPEGASVLDVEKDAVVLLCEALATVGDRFAIAGFSGNGRHCVEYSRIKGFEENLDETVRGRIGAMRSYRSTRMGAAIRHATVELAAQDAAVRLMVVLGDGFPNDVDYKREYAVSDTRKAVQEARSKGIHVHAVTVNIAADPLLDEMYGWNRHTVISDVTELPEKLVRIYSRLTKA